MRAISRPPRTTIVSFARGMHMEPLIYKSTRRLLLLLSVIVMAVGLIGNCSVIYVFGWVRRKGRPVIEFMFLLLGVADLFCIMVALPVQSHNFYTDKVTSFNEFVRFKIAPTFWPLTYFMSQVLLVVICIERYRAVVYPFSRRLRPRTVLIIYACSFLLGLAIYLPFAALSGKGKYVSSMNMSLDLNHSVGTRRERAAPKRTNGKPIREHYIDNIDLYFIHSSVNLGRDCVSLIILCVLIYKMIKALKRNEETLKGHTSNPASEEKSKAVQRTMIIVIVAFFFCVFPKDLVAFGYAMDSYIHGYPSRKTEIIFANVISYLEILQIANCASNVFVYSYYHPGFESCRKNCMKRTSYVLHCCREEEETAKTSSEIEMIKDASHHPFPAKDTSYTFTAS